MSASHVIFLWGTRRVLSTALQRALFQLNGIKHISEPFDLPFYFDPNRSIQLQDHQDMTATWHRIPTYGDSLANILRDYPSEGYHKVFVKEHAIYAYPDAVPDDILISAKNTFLIRHRRAYALDPFEESLWDRLVPQEVGYEE
eukprot:353024_1